jgi:hypothetical protein
VHVTARLITKYACCYPGTLSLDNIIASDVTNSVQQEQSLTEDEQGRPVQTAHLDILQTK